MQCTNKKCAAELVENAVYCHICGKKQEAAVRKHRKRANGHGTVYKASGNRKKPWRAEKDSVLIGYYETQKEAFEVLNSLSSRTVTDRFNLTFKEVYELWKGEHFRKLGEKGKQAHETAYKHFAALHNLKFRDIKTSHYQTEVDKLIELGKSYSTCNNLRKLAGQLSKWAMREELITTNYAQFIALQENVTKEREILSDKEIEKMENSVDETAKITLMLIYTGMRISELFEMPAANYHGTYCIGGIKTEAGKNRVIPVHSKVKKHFDYFAGKAESDGLLLSGFSGNKVVRQFREKDYYPMLELLGIPKKTPHCARHTYSSMAVKAGMRPETLQKILGHADYETTANIYVHADIDTLVKANESIVSGGNKDGDKTQAA